MWIYRDPRTTVSYRQETLIPPKVTLTVKHQDITFLLPKYLRSGAEQPQLETEQQRQQAKWRERLERFKARKPK